MSIPGLLIVAACIFWGIDNNLTRDVIDLPAMDLAGIKGLVAGVFNIAMALLFTSGDATGYQAAGALAIGAVSYGLSLVFFIEALRRIGAARTATYFAVGPFFGTLLSIVVLGERLPPPHWFAAILMISGVFLLYREKHALFHRHGHIHDEHHIHTHQWNEEKGLHDHPHNHEPLTHIHGHWPDIHHRHGHRR
jgi:drug/metabolite transporter (DMT)-like permease